MNKLAFALGLCTFSLFTGTLEAQQLNIDSEQAFLARESSSVNPDFQRFYNFAAELNKSFTPFCVPAPTIDASTVLRKSQGAETVIFAAIANEGIADKAGLKEGDILISINGKPAGETTFRGYIRNVFTPSLEEALKLKTSVDLVVAKGGADGSRVDIKLTPLEACSNALPTFNPTILLSGEVDGDKNSLVDRYSKEEIFKYAYVKALAWQYLDQSTTGTQVTKALNIISAIVGNPGVTNNNAVRYTTNDLLRVELLTMMALNRLQIPIDKYLTWATSQYAEWPRSTFVTKNIFNLPWHFDDAAKKMLSANLELIKQGKATQALNEMAIKLTSAQVNYFFPSTAEPNSLARLDDVDSVPTSANCRKLYAQWLGYQFPRAFAISSSGHCSHTSGFKPPDPEAPKDPIERAIWVCEKVAKSSCKMYAIDTAVVWQPNK